MKGPPMPGSLGYPPKNPSLDSGLSGQEGKSVAEEVPAPVANRGRGQELLFRVEGHDDAGFVEKGRRGIDGNYFGKTESHSSGQGRRQW